MKKIILLIVASFFLFSGGNIQGQIPEVGCSTPSPDYNKVMSAEKVNNLIAAKLVNATYTVHVMFHLIRNSDGSDGPTNQEVMDQLNNFMIPNFAAGDIDFNLEGINYIDDDAYANTSNYLNLTTGILYPMYGQTCRLDIFVFPSGLGDLSGNAFDIPNDYLAMSQLRFGTSQNLSHEIGHTLGLFHTHETCFTYCASLANPMETDITYETDCSFGASVNITGPTNIGQENCPGSIVRYTYTVTDDCGRTSAPVTRDFIVQNDGPTIECPAFNLLLECGDANNTDYIEAHIGLVTANSSCGSDVTISYFPQNFNNITCNTATTVTFTATDACGRTATCTTIVNISDNTAPEITSVYEDGICNEAVCGSDLNFWYNAWKDKVMEGLSAIDACDTNVSISAQGPNSPSQNCPDETRETLVNFVATDNCGNTSYISYSFYVTALDTPEPPQTSSIAGMVHTETMEGVENVEVYLSGGANLFELFVTGSEGNYAFDNVPLDQNYSITPLYNQFPMNGVSSFDLILIAKHFLDIEQLDSPYKIIAADINHSGSVTTLDLVELRKMILMIDSEFANNTSWRFVDANFVFPNAANPFVTAFPEIVNVNGLLESVQHDFVGVKIGDVNGTVVPNNLIGGDGRSFNGDLSFNVQDVEMEVEESYEVAFSASEFEAIMGYQYTLNFDTDLLEFVKVRGGDLDGMSDANFGLSLLHEGAITTSWTNDRPLRLSEDVALYYVTFTAKRATLLSEALSISSRYTNAEAYDVSTGNGQLNLLNIALRFDDALSTKFTLMQNTPNPFSDETVIGFILPEATFANMTIYDVSGSVLKSIEGNYEAGYNEVSLDRSDLKSGMMYYTLTTSDRTLTKKMLMISNQ